MKTPHIPPAVWFAAAATTQHAVTRRRPTTLRSRIVSSALASAALALGANSIREFARLHTTIHPHKTGQSSALVTDGVHQITRNPMYVALAGGLVAQAVARRSLVALVPAAAFVAVMNATQIPAEEHGLTATFGPEYERYCATVPRWITPGSIARFAR